MAKRAIFCALALLFSAACTKSNNNNSVPQQPTPSPSSSPSPTGAAPGALSGGFSLAVPTTGEGGSLREVGLHPSLALNGDEDPMVAYLAKEPGAGAINLCFVAWDRKAGRWTTPVTIDTVSEVFADSPQLQLARDASNNTLGVAYHKSSDDVELALSTDNGATWKKEKVSVAGVEASAVASNPALALAQGKEYVSFFTGDALYLLTRSGASGAFTPRSAPTLPGTGKPREVAPALSVDSSGRPALAYFLEPQEGYTMVVAFWRPDEATPYKVTDSNNEGSDAPYISLAFAGDKPRVAVNMMRNEDNFNTGPTYFIASDDGRTWDAPVHVMKDGGNAMDGFISVAAHTQAGAAIAAPVTGGNQGDTRCGKPKLARSTDSRMWTTCSPDASNNMNLDARYSSLVFDRQGKLYLAFENTQESPSLGRGLIVWREP